MTSHLVSSRLLLSRLLLTFPRSLIWTLLSLSSSLFDILSLTALEEHIVCVLGVVVFLRAFLKVVRAGASAIPLFVCFVGSTDKSSALFTR